ncbi:hypothetical protein NFI96_008901, partial [Prochilodus magdalenae]
MYIQTTSLLNHWEKKKTQGPMCQESIKCGEMLQAPRQETSTLQEGDAEGSGEPRGDGGQCGEEEMQDESQSQPPKEDMVHGGGIINDSVCASNDARSDTTDGDEQEGKFGNTDFQCVPKGAESVAVGREATKATED